MVLFCAIVLLIFWYWRIGEWELVKILHVYPSGYDSILLKMLRPLRLSPYIEDKVWWLSQLITLIPAWRLRVKLGHLVERCVRAI